MPKDTKNRRWTAYCKAHGAIERVDEITDVRSFQVERLGLMGFPERTGQTAREVRAITDDGCKVHFIGGPWWN